MGRLVCSSEPKLHIIFGHNIYIHIIQRIIGFIVKRLRLGRQVHTGSKRQCAPRTEWSGGLLDRVVQANHVAVCQPISGKLSQPISGKLSSPYKPGSTSRFSLCS